MIIYLIIICAYIGSYVIY